MVNDLIQMNSIMEKIVEEMKVHILIVVHIQVDNSR
jgi:hypothetical protein